MLATDTLGEEIWHQHVTPTALTGPQTGKSKFVDFLHICRYQYWDAYVFKYALMIQMFRKRIYLKIRLHP